LVDGKLDITEYTDKDGQKRTSFRILADAYRLL
jgi:single-stranded DNA-binding protein